MTKKLEIPQGHVFPNKYWRVICEAEQRGRDRYFLCECLLCNRNYEVKINNLKNENKCFCCQSCAAVKYHETKANELIGKVFGRLTVISKHSQNKDGHWQYLCECFCGAEKVIIGRSLVTQNTTSCGCYKKQSARERISGDKHPNWQGGKTPQNDSDRVKIKRNINPIIRERDDYTCQQCSQYGGYLEIHHIYDFSTYQELKFNPYNLITLCKKCHKDFHSIYPKTGTNTLFDLEDWMSKEYQYRDELLAALYNA